VCRNFPISGPGSLLPRTRPVRSVASKIQRYARGAGRVPSLLQGFRRFRGSEADRYGRCGEPVDGNRARHSSRCHRTTVSGCTSTTAVRHYCRIRLKVIQNSRSRVWRCGRFVVRFRVVSCCFSARFPRPIPDGRGAPPPAHGRSRSAAPACVDRGRPRRGTQRRRVLARVSAADRAEASHERSVARYRLESSACGG
jgi:hypothetical protein